MPKRTRSAAKPAAPFHLGEKFARAIDYARHLHIEKRKGSDIPSMAHILGVASLVMGEVGRVSFPITEDMVVAALLHDTVEDHGGAPRLRDIEFNFGPDVARMVKGLSDSLEENPQHKQTWEQRKRGYVRRLAREPLDVQLISAADKLYNARTILDDYRHIGPEVWTRFQRGRDLQIWYFRALLNVFTKSRSNRIVEELLRVVDELDRVSAGDRARPD